MSQLVFNYLFLGQIYRKKQKWLARSFAGCIRWRTRYLFSLGTCSPTIVKNILSCILKMFIRTGPCIPHYFFSIANPTRAIVCVGGGGGGGGGGVECIWKCPLACIFRALVWYWWNTCWITQTIMTVCCRRDMTELMLKTTQYIIQVANIESNLFFFYT